MMVVVTCVPVLRQYRQIVTLNDFVLFCLESRQLIDFY